MIKEDWKGEIGITLGLLSLDFYPCILTLFFLILAFIYLSFVSFLNLTFRLLEQIRVRLFLVISRFLIINFYVKFLCDDTLSYHYITCYYDIAHL